MVKNRTAPRLRSLLKGSIIFNNRRSTIDCVIRDVSATGARLSIADHVLLPDCFELYVPLKEKSYSVQVRWRADEEVGVMFVAGNETAGAELSHAKLQAQVDQLESEVSNLHATLAKLMSRLEGP